MYAQCIIESFNVLPMDMESEAERLRFARQRLGFDTAKQAIDRFGWVEATYYGHENGSRGLTRAAARRYAKAYRVSLDWLLDGRGEIASPEVQKIFDQISLLDPEVAAALGVLTRALVAARAPRPTKG